MNIQYIGIIAGVCTAISTLPQLVKIIKTKKADDLSWFYLVILAAGLASWVAYGIGKKDYPVIITNAFSFLVNAAIIICKGIFGGNKSDKAGDAPDKHQSLYTWEKNN